MDSQVEDCVPDKEEKELVPENIEPKNQLAENISAQKGVNLFSYIDHHYTTEIFKIEIRNLPKRVEHHVRIIKSESRIICNLQFLGVCQIFAQE